jgi:hypothetical protein
MKKSSIHRGGWPQPSAHRWVGVALPTPRPARTGNFAISTRFHSQRIDWKSMQRTRTPPRAARGRGGRALSAHSGCRCWTTPTERSARFTVADRRAPGHDTAQYGPLLFNSGGPATRLCCRPCRCRQQWGRPAPGYRYHSAMDIRFLGARTPIDCDGPPVAAALGGVDPAGSTDWRPVVGLAAGAAEPTAESCCRMRSTATGPADQTWTSSARATPGAEAVVPGLLQGSYMGAR